MKLGLAPVQIGGKGTVCQVALLSVWAAFAAAPAVLHVVFQRVCLMLRNSGANHQGFPVLNAIPRRKCILTR